MITSFDITYIKVLAILILLFSCSCSDNYQSKVLSNEELNRVKLEYSNTKINLPVSESVIKVKIFKHYESDSIAIYYDKYNDLEEPIWDAAIFELTYWVNYHYKLKPTNIAHITLYFKDFNPTTDTLSFDSLLACQIYLLAPDGTSHHRLFVRDSEKLELQEEMSCESFPVSTCDYVKNKYLNELTSQSHISVINISSPYELDNNKEIYTYYGLLKFMERNN